MLQNINVRFTPPEPVEMGAHIQQSLSAARTSSGRTPSAVQAISSEVQALADGLEGDPLRIYDYVHNHVDFIPTWGLFKSPRETLLSGYGNPFDQAELLAALLQASGYTTRYAFGTIQISKSQAMNWTGVTDSSVVAYAFTNGGTSTTDTGTDIEIEHVWVEVSISGTWYPLDPSFKSYVYRSGLDLASILGYNQTAFLNAAAGTRTPDYVRYLDDNQIRNWLADYSNNLLAHLDTNDPFAYPQDVIGGREIVSETFSSLPTILPYTVVTNHGSATTFSDDFKYLLRVQLAGIDYQVPLAEVAGERLTIFYEGTTYTDRNTIAAAGGIYKVYPAYEVNMTPHLRLNGVLVDSGYGRKLGSSETIDVMITTPIPDGLGGYLQYGFTQQVTTGAWYALPIRAQGVSLATLERHYDQLRGNMELDPETEAHLGQALYTLGMSYFNQVDFASELDAQIGGIVEIPFFSVMLMSQDLATEWEYVSDDWEVARVGMASYTIDVQMNLNSSVSANGDESMEIAYMLSSGIKGSAAEHATIEQLQGVAAVSTIRALAVANAEGQKIYNLTSLSQLGELDYSQLRLLSLSDFLSANYEILIPMADIAQGGWGGAGWIIYDPDSGSAGYLISGSLGGGQSSSQGKASAEQAVDQAASVSDINMQGKSFMVEDPVCLLNGALHQYERGVSLDGNLSLDPSYDSDRAGIDGPLGYGWTHSYEFNLQTGSDWARGMGTGTAADAASAIAAAYVSLDILDATPGTLPYERLLISSIGADWALGQLTDNSVTVQGPWGTVQYLARSDGSYAPSAGFDRTLTRLADGRYTLQGKDGATVHFNGVGLATALTDADGNQTTLSYNSLDQLRRVAGPTGRGFSFFYDDGRITQVTDAAGRILHFTYDVQGNLINYTNARGGEVAYTYDGQHHILTVIDPEGDMVVNNTYDALGRVAQQANGRGLTAHILYGGDHATLIDPAGRRATYFYDTRGRLTGVEDDLGYKTAASYDAHDNLLSYTDANGHTLNFTYDARANLTSITNISGTIILDYDNEDNLVQVTDALDNTTQYAYDDWHNLTRITDAQNHITQMAYDKQGHLTTLTDAQGAQTRYIYDVHGHTIGVLGPLDDDETRMYYDSAGRLIRLTDAYSQTTYMAYDANDNLTTMTNTLGYASHYAYDGNDNLTQVTSPQGADTYFGYDGQFNLVVVTDTLGHVMTYTYDASDYLVGITDANGHETTYQRDALGYATVITDALSRATHFTYDGEGNLLTRRKASGDVITYTYDALDRLTNIVYPDDTSVLYGYDAVGNLASATYGPWEARYQYDELNRLDETLYPALGRTVAYAYDPVGHTQAITATEETITLYRTLYQVHYLYDEAGRLTHLVDDLNGATINTTHDLLGNLLSISYANGATTDYVYDSEGQVLQIETHTPVDGLTDRVSYSYDLDGNPLQIIDMVDGGTVVTRTYTYDLAGRLTSESYANYTATYDYDAASNLVHYANVSDTIVYAYDDANQLLWANAVTYTHDINGNRTGKVDAGDVYTYHYDYENRLVDWLGPLGNGQVTYDAFGRRTTVSGADGISLYLFNGMQIILEDWQPEIGDSWEAAFLYDVDGRLLARQGGPGSVSFHGDALGNVRHLVNEAGAATDAYRYHPYGLPLMTNGADVNPYRFVGQWSVRAEPFDDSLYWMGFRVQDASSSRFLTPDPLPGLLDLPVSQNRYLYVNATPMCAIDFCGLRLVNIGKLKPEIEQPTGAIENPADQYQEALSGATQNIARNALPQELESPDGPHEGKKVPDPDCECCE